MQNAIKGNVLTISLAVYHRQRQYQRFSSFLFHFFHLIIGKSSWLFFFPLFLQLVYNTSILNRLTRFGWRPPGCSTVQIGTIYNSLFSGPPLVGSLSREVSKGNIDWASSLARKASPQFMLSIFFN
jgi:hypothetical protein